MPVRPCVVSFSDAEGLRHSVEVQAESLYEAAILALRTFREHDCAPGPAARLDVEVRTSVTHTVTVAKVQDWLNGARSPAERTLKSRLKTVLADQCP